MAIYFNNRKGLQNIAINHSSDIDYENFVKIYRECTKNRLFFDKRHLQKVL